jgi:plasmid stabilization system protein ParE
MEITKIYWRADALNNLKDIFALYHRQGRKISKRFIENMAKSLEALKERPYNGYIETSLMNQPKKILSYYITIRKIKVLYYTEDDALYIIDFLDD